MSARYVLDVRCGCVGIRDTEHPDYPSSPGLWEGLPDVVRYWPGENDHTTGGWSVADATLALATETCRRLNAGEVLP